MIRVMIVEDEAPILRNIRERIQAADSEFEICAVAYNGREAIELLSNTAVEVLFVDMNLPVVSGMEVLSYVKEAKPDIIPVVLSGYKDFRYVKHAFEHEVADYLLKPLKEEELQAVLARIRQTLRGRQQRRSEAQLEHALRGGSRPEYEQEDKGYHMVIFTAGNYYQAPEMEGNVYYEMLGKERLQELFSRCFGEGVFWCVDGGSIMDKVAFVKHADMLNLSYMNSVLSAFREDQLPVTITVNRSLICVNEIYDTYYKMRGFIESHMLFGQSAVLIYHGGLDHGGQEPKKDLHEVILRCRNNPSPAYMYEQLKKLLEELMERPVKQYVIRKLVRQFWSELCHEVAGHKTYVEIEDDINFILSHNYTLEGLLEEFRFLFDQCYAAGEAMGKDKKALAAMVKEYLDGHYRQDITNQTISDVFGLVPSYLSNIFKEYYEVSMGEYLIWKRITTAKYLLDEGEMKIKEIASHVGYKDPLYFSKAFKKSVGMSPREYMKQDETEVKKRDQI